MLSDETIIVTGASQGLGASMAKRFAAEGANVVLTARSEEKLQDIASESDGETLVIKSDVTDEKAVQRVVSETQEQYGAITGLVNNAAIGLLSLYDEQYPLHEVNVEDFRRILEVNVIGAFLYSKYVVPEMLSQGRGNIINISSGLGRRVSTNWGPYVTSKWALEGMTQTQALELESTGVNVNGLDPGGRVDTGFWDHLPETERNNILDIDVMNDAAVRLLAQGPDGITGESMPAQDWEQKFS